MNYLFLKWIVYVIGALSAAAWVTIFWMSPPGEFNPFCTYDSQYELSASLRVGDQLLQSTVRTQSSHSRRWIRGLNHAGCQQSYGTALSFRASDGRVFLVPTTICPLAKEVMHDLEKVDVLRMCRKRWRNKTIGTIVTTASKPVSWQPFNFIESETANLVAMNANSYRWGSPSDDIDDKIPNLLNTSFETGSNSWSSPSRILGRHSEIIYHARKLQTEVK